MFNVCPRCGTYSDAKIIDPAGPFAICPACGYAHPFVQLPLFVITGASGAGKTALCLALPPRLPECVVLETDILWGVVPATAEDDYRSYANVWLRVAKNVSQGGRPVVLGGSTVPGRFEACPERRYFTDLHYLALVCDDAVLVERLRARPGWRESGIPTFLDSMRAFNRWFLDHAATTDPPMTLLDTSRLSLDETAAQAAGWVRERLAGV